MTQKIIALDAMGGDHGPTVTVAAAALALREIPGIALVLVGDRERLAAEVDKNGLSGEQRVRNSQLLVSCPLADRRLARATSAPLHRQS